MGMTIIMDRYGVLVLHCLLSCRTRPPLIVTQSKLALGEGESDVYACQSRLGQKHGWTLAGM